MNIMEPGRRINPSEDYPVQFACGCMVTFTGSSFHRTCTVTHCIDHMDDRLEQDRIAHKAKNQLRLAMLNQPPV